MKNTFAINSLNGTQYKYNYKYNLLQLKETYNDHIVEDMAQKHYTCLLPISEKEFVEKQIHEKYRCLNLVLTDDCNFRCSYCANSSMYMYSKGYQKQSMSLEIIHKAITLYVDNYRKQVQADPNMRFIIMFYGGEPMLEFEKIKYAVKLVKKNKAIENPVYTVTTNGSIITEEILHFFEKNDFWVNISMDGYKEIHDLNRKTSSGKKTFDKIVENFYKLYDRLGKERVGIITTFDTQVSPMKLYEFYSKNSKIDECLKRVASVGSVNTQYYEEIVSYPYYEQEVYELYKLIKSGDQTHFLKQLFNNKFTKMLSRKEFCDKTFAICSPMSAKLTVSTNGNLHICEKINENYPIGNVDEGINKKMAYDYYKQLVDIRHMRCSNCKIRNLCEPCFALISREGKKFDIYDEECLENKRSAIRMLEEYCTFLDVGEWPNRCNKGENDILYNKL